VDAELRQRFEALRRPLILASADGFKGVAKIGGLGDALRVACDRVLELCADAPLRAWRESLAKFEQLDERARAVEVARGLRLVQTAAGAAPTPPTSSISANPARPVPKRATRSDPKPEARGPGPEVPTPAASDLASSVTVLKGIGPALALALREKGVETLEDLLWVLPRRYDDARDVARLADVIGAPDGQRVTFRARVDSARMIFGRGRRWGDVRVSDGPAEPAGPSRSVTRGGPARLVVRCFNVWGGLDKRFPIGAEVVLSGVLRHRGPVAEMSNPDVLVERAIIPRYPDVQGVPAARLRAACAAAVARIGDHVDDGVPATVVERAGVVPLAEALRVLHAPPVTLSVGDVAALNDRASAWQRRLAWGELFVLGVLVARRRRERRSDVAVPCPPAHPLDAELARALPFAPTAAQRRAIAELRADLAGPVPMNRLLQGDVGAGKTAVAFAAALQVARAGRQAALMVPTEILAEQHHATLTRWAERVGLRTTILTASVPKGVRASRLALCAAGEIDLVVGTHALLAEGVGFARLGLTIVDEQHRFGVAQRVRLRGKATDGAPHLLVMTATPIPRTLALTAYGDLDVTVLDELPPGRTPPATRVLWGAKGRAQAHKLVRERVAAGERVFVVCPLVEPSTGEDGEPIDRADAMTVHDELTRTLAPARVGLVHGRLATPEREAVMGAFARGELDVLVATTVIEVGVDVPAATVMIVEDADGFGLAQLHQLRGRVGRGGGRAWCVLLARGPATDDGRRRLDVLAETCDGFRIAEEDLALRGPGELLGARQAGLPRLRFGDLRQHTELLLEARRQAEAVIDTDPSLADPAHAGLRAALERRLRGAPAFGAEGG
jgi:ATP-dependent DNA helicase RecG